MSNFFFSLKTVREFHSTAILPQIVIEILPAKTFQRCIPVKYLERGNLYVIWTADNSANLLLHYYESRNIIYIPFSYPALLHLCNQNCCQFCSEGHKNKWILMILVDLWSFRAMVLLDDFGSGFAFAPGCALLSVSSWTWAFPWSHNIPKPSWSSLLPWLMVFLWLSELMVACTSLPVNWSSQPAPAGFVPHRKHHEDKWISDCFFISHSGC